VSPTTSAGGLDRADTIKPIGDCHWRERVRVRGRIRALRIQPWEGGVATLEATLVDGTGGITVIFMGRRRIAGLRLGEWMEVEGMVLESRGKLAIMNPEYSLLTDPDAHPA
jgi:hypothetical protein